MTSHSWQSIEIDGNDGVGKSTLVRLLAEYGIQTVDRGDMTRAASSFIIAPRPNVLYLLLDVPAQVSRQRLADAGKPLDELFHREEDLSHYRKKFLELVERFGAVLIEPLHPRSTLQAALAAILKRPLRVGIPAGRRSPNVLGLLDKTGFLIRYRASARVTRVQGLEASLLQNRVFPELLALGLIDVAFCGRDILLESEFAGDLVELLDTGKDSHPLTVAVSVPDALYEEMLDGNNKRSLRVATSYPRISQRWLEQQSYTGPVVLLESFGDSAAMVPHFADVMVDLSSDDVLNEHGLFSMEVLSMSSTVLVGHRDRCQTPAVRAFVDSVRSAVNSETPSPMG